MTKTQAAPFTPFEGHRRMTPEDAAIFETAAEMLIWPDVHSALNGAGGDLANHYYFSQQVCTNRPARLGGHLIARSQIIAHPHRPVCQRRNCDADPT